MANMNAGKPGLAHSLEQLQEIHGVTDEQVMELLGDALYTAMQQNNYAFITIADMMKLADAFGMVFIMNFQSIDVYNLAGSEEQLDDA